MFDPENFSGKKACVLGGGRSGVECARLLSGKGFSVILSESKTCEIAPVPGVEIETGGHTDKIISCGFAVKSPGIPSKSSVLQKLRSAGIPVFSEVETALAFCPECEVFAVTGTNGKTTTTALLAEILAESVKKTPGKKALAGGNIGTAASKLALEAKKGDFLALELSSYQLEDSTYIKPHAACVLNLTPDHLERHGSMDGYAEAKKKIFAFQDGTDSCVFNAEDGLCLSLAKNCPSRALFFSSTKQGGNLNGRVKDGKIIFSLGEKTSAVLPPELPGVHNLENAMAAGLMALSAGVSPDDISAAFAGFKGVPHRLEDCGLVGGVRFINDSKATNVDSTLTALRAFGSGGKNVWLVLGGLGKGSPYNPLYGHISKSVKAILTIGSDARKIEKELSGSAPLISCGSLERAVDACLERAEPGDILLFSPACASFDQFRDFEDRGNFFKNLARAKLTGHSR